MEHLQRKHRQEQKDLQSRITQKKKSATKKTRKGVNDECADLERELHEKQIAELRLFDEEETHANGRVPVESSPEDSEDMINEKKSPELESSMETLPISMSVASSSQAKKPNRQKARLARRAAEQEAVTARAAEEAADLPDLRESERLAMLKEVEARGLKEQEIRSDGHCLYAAVADQLTESGIDLELGGRSGIADEKANATLPSYKRIRQTAAQYVLDHPDDFTSFLEEPLDEYVVKIRDTGEWGGQLELSALARAYGVDINVLQGDGRVEKIEAGSEGTATAIWLAYYRHSFGLGEHYNSLRQMPRRTGVDGGKD
ncbi:hypothetical protein MMC24_001930 [Lignoscripta atroalba]|nr:hypothetical protein [Lignoscripta atroalba]